jgi:(R)-2-hydroxyacyl-CoA dehydratese activating ATPase
VFTMGIDVGSASSKAVILDHNAHIVAAEVVQVGTGSTGPQRVITAVLGKSGLKLDDIKKIVATGYGRFVIKEADRQISEISCHAKGIFHVIPTARVIIDIGGQDSKAITLDKNGMVNQFFMSDKCAAGTGRFLDVMARVLEITIEELADYDSRATEPASISSTCTVFAESEVISQLANGTSKENIVAGIHQSVAVRACGLARRGGIEPDVVMSGGVAQNEGVVRAISAALNQKVIVAPNPQIMGALGAALFAYEEVKKSDGVMTNHFENKGKEGVL